MRTSRWTPFPATALALAVVAGAPTLLAQPAQVEDLRLERMYAYDHETFWQFDLPGDTLGHGLVLPEGAQVALEVRDQGRWSTIRSPDAGMVTLLETGLPFQVVLLLPNTDAYNGIHRPDGSADAPLRRGVLAGLGAFPSEGTDIRFDVGLYNEQVDWDYGYVGRDVASLREGLTARRAFAPVGTTAEDPFEAIQDAHFQALREGVVADDPFAQFVVVVASVSASLPRERVAGRVYRLQSMLQDQDVGHVETTVILRGASDESEALAEAGEEQVLLARLDRRSPAPIPVVHGDGELEASVRSTLEDIAALPVLRFGHPELRVTDRWCELRLVVEGPGGRHATPPVLTRWCVGAAPISAAGILRALVTAAFAATLLGTAAAQRRRRRRAALGGPPTPAAAPADPSSAAT